MNTAMKFNSDSFSLIRAGHSITDSGKFTGDEIAQSLADIVSEDGESEDGESEDQFIERLVRASRMDPLIEIRGEGGAPTAIMGQDFARELYRNRHRFAAALLDSIELVRPHPVRQPRNAKGFDPSAFNKSRSRKS